MPSSNMCSQVAPSNDENSSQRALDWLAHKLSVEPDMSLYTGDSMNEVSPVHRNAAVAEPKRPLSPTAYPERKE